MKLSIIPSDGTVFKDGLAYIELDLTSANIPADVHALQWKDTQGHIEYTDDNKLEEEITELPTWANTCVSIWETADAEEQALLAQQEAQRAAKQAAQQS